MHHKQLIFHSLPAASVAYVLTHKVKTVLYSQPIFICPLATLAPLTPDSPRSPSRWPASAYFPQRCAHKHTHTDVNKGLKYIFSLCDEGRKEVYSLCLFTVMEMKTEFPSVRLWLQWARSKKHALREKHRRQTSTNEGGANTEASSLTSVFSLLNNH